MNKIAITLLLVASIFCACKKDKNTFTLGIDVQSSFNQDSVRIFIDGQELINKRLQTNYALGVCFVDGQVTTALNEGQHEIKVSINNAITKTETFNLHNNLYIGVNSDQSSDVSLIYSNERFIYD
ncbi:MAG: hypothetical protein ACTHLE_05975 [Agriterribacter sp.]